MTRNEDHGCAGCQNELFRESGQVASLDDIVAIYRTRVCTIVLKIMKRIILIVIFVGADGDG